MRTHTNVFKNMNFIHVTCQCGSMDFIDIKPKQGGFTDFIDAPKFVQPYDRKCVSCGRPYYDKEERDLFTVLGYEP